MTDCPLRWMAERHGGTDVRDLGSTVGSVVHALIAEPAGSEAELLAALERAWQHLPFESRWYADNELARHRTMIETFLAWRAQTRGELTEVGVEVDVDGVLDGNVRLRGRVDRIERDAAGRLVIVDVKTGKTPVSKDDAQRHAQLAAYQLAVAEGLVEHGDEPGGGRLVYLGKTGSAGATEREQDPLTPNPASSGGIGSAKRRGRRPARSSSPGSTMGARIARCGRAARLTPGSTGRIRHDRHGAGAF